MSERYEAFGQFLEAARQRVGLTQSDFAAQIKSTQQTVSRWESGKSRPRDKEVPILSRVLKVDQEELLRAAGYLREGVVVASVDKPLPLYALAPETFERFCADFLERKYRDAHGRVYRAGGTGHKQDGIDITVELGGEPHVFQCKRVNEFGPAKVQEAIRLVTQRASKKVLMLSITASPAARKEVTATDWEIWDQDDIARMFRQLSKQDQKQLVDTFFQGQRRELLGEDDSSPWLTIADSYQPHLREESAFTHIWALVGRQDEREELTAALESPDVLVTLLVGPGGGGKTRLLLDVLQAFQGAHPERQVLLLDRNSQVSRRDLDNLGQGEQLLVVDDAHDREDLALVLQHVAKVGGQCKALFALRPYGLETLRYQAAYLSLDGPEVRQIKLQRPSLPEATKLAAQVLSYRGGPVELAEEIAKLTFESPLTTVLAAHIAARDKLHPQFLARTDEFKHLVYQEFERVITEGLAAGKQGDKLRKILGVIALVQPVVVDDEALIRLMEEVEGVSLSEAVPLLRLLVDAGILFRRGRTYRLSPDLLADSIIERNCVNQKSESTGYAERVFDRAPVGYLKNLMVNLGKFDWRSKDGDTSSSSLLNGLWAKLQWQHEYANPHVEAAAAVAYFQPRHALNFAARLIRDGHGGNSEVCNIIKYAGYNIDFVEEACLLLWKIGRDDERRLNSHPEHAIRILKELAEPRPNATVEYIRLVVKFALDLVKSPRHFSGAYTPFDILESALRTEGRSLSGGRMKLTLTPFRVNLEVMRDVRESIIKALLSCLVESQDRRAVAAAGLLSKALRGLEESQSAALLRRIYEVAGFSAMSPVVLARVASACSWFAHYGAEGESRELSKKILTLLHKDLRTRIIRILSDGWGSDLFEQKPEGRDGLMKELEHLTNELAATYSDPAMLCDFMRACLLEIRTVTGAAGNAEHVFVNHLLRCNERFAAEVAACTGDVVAHPLRSYRGAALGALLSSGAGRARAEELKSASTPEALMELAEAYQHYCPKQGYTVADMGLLKSLMKSKDPRVGFVASSLIWDIARNDKQAALKLVLDAEFGDSSQHAHQYFGVLGQVDFESFSDEQLVVLLEKLVTLPDLEDYWIGEFVQKTLSREPKLIIKLTQERLAAAMKDDEARFHPFSYSFSRNHPCNLMALDEGPRLLRELLDWAVSRIWDVEFRGHFGQAIGSLCHPYSQAFVDVIADWMRAGSNEHVAVVAAVLQHAQCNFVFEHESYVAAVLGQAELISPEALKELSDALWTSAASRGGSTNPGEPFPHDLELRDGSKRALSRLSLIDPAYELYRNLLEVAESGIERQRKTKEDLLDGDDE